MPAAAVYVPSRLTDLSVDVSLSSPVRGDLLFRGATQWNNLHAGTAGQVLASQGSGNDPHWVDATGGTDALSALTVDVSLSSVAQGDVFYRGASKWNNLHAGTAGQVLATGGAGANPSWVNRVKNSGDTMTDTLTVALANAAHHGLVVTSPASFTGDYWQCLDSGSTPVARLDPNGILRLQPKTGVSAACGIVADAYGSGNFALYRGRVSGGSQGSPSAVAANQSLVRLDGVGYAGSGFGSALGHVSVRSSETWSGSAQGSMIVFGVTPNGTTTTQDLIRFDHDGTIRLGSGDSNDATLLKVANLKLGTYGSFYIGSNLLELSNRTQFVGASYASGVGRAYFRPISSANSAVVSAMPNGTPTWSAFGATTLGGAVESFATDYTADPTNYRRFLLVAGSDRCLLTQQVAGSPTLQDIVIRQGSLDTQVIGAAGDLTSKVTDSVTSAVTPGLTLGHNSSGTPAAGFGSSLRFRLNSSTADDRDAADFEWSWATATDGSRKALGVLHVFDTAAREALRVEASGSAPKIGFLGASAVARPSAYTLTGSATRTLPTDPGSAYSGIDNAQSGSVYAQLSDLNTLRTAVSTLLGVVRQLISDFSAGGGGNGLLG